LDRYNHVLGKVLLSITTAFTESRTLGTGRHFAECQTLDERRCSTEGRQQPFITDGRYLCRAPGFGTPQTRRSANHALPSATVKHSAKYFLFFFTFFQPNFCGMFLYYVDLHVLFWHIYQSVCYNY
jgi:hypothetical protein